MAKKSAKKRTAKKRELIDTGKDKRYVRRDDQGQFKEVDEQGRSLSQDRRRKAKTASKPGQGDKGDRPSSKSSSSKSRPKKAAKRRKSSAK
jgi:hypothetical protein